MKGLYGQINFDELYEMLKNQPELVKKVTFKNGKTARMVNVSIVAMKNTDNYGNTMAIKINPRDKKKEGANYYFGKLKESSDEWQSSETEVRPAKPVQEQDPLQGDREELPF